MSPADTVPGRIQAELKPAKPSRTLQEEAFLTVVRTADGLLCRADRMLRGHGLTGTQYNVLRILRGAGEAGATCRHIGERLINAEPDITRLLDRMEKRGLITRSREAADRRFVTTRITPLGLEAVNSLDEPITAFHRERFAGLSKAELKHLIAGLQKIRAAAKPE
jgi:DNA-binding MarR family transcriptional regulator